jgi:hypothetical protein
MRLVQKAIHFGHPVDGGFGPAPLLDDGIDFLSKYGCMFWLGSQIIQSMRKCLHRQLSGIE